MIFTIAVALALLTSVTWRLWRVVLERETRWKLYALRDELRWAAIDDRALLESKAFWMLDRSLTRDAQYLEKLSVWMLLPVIAAMPSTAEQRTAQTHRAVGAHPVTSKIYDASVKLFVGHLQRRHALLFGVTAVVFALGSVFGASKSTKSPAQRVAEELFVIGPGANASPA